MSKAAAQHVQRRVKYDNATTKGPKTAASSEPKQAPKLNIGRELLDTTWRMTIPVVLFAGLGIVLDRQINSAPWLTLIGMIVGFLLAGILVKRQLDRWPADLKIGSGKYKNYYKDEDDENKDYYND